MDNLVSIIIPCYNGEKFIDQSIRSVWEQDYPRIELIVIDDGSVDQSRVKILAWQKAFQDRGLVLKYLYQENQGPGAATNYGLKHVTGAYLTLLDADDVYLPGAIRKKAEFLDAHPDYAGVRNNGWMVKGDNKRLFITEDTEKRITDLFGAICDDKTNNWAGTYMVRTEILFWRYPKRNIAASRFGQNFQILLPVAYGQKFGYIDEPLMEYRLQPESHSQSSDPLAQYQKSLVNIKGWHDIFCDVLQWLVTNDEERKGYLSRYEAAALRDVMYQAASVGLTEDVKKHFTQLRQKGHVTLDDYIFFARFTAPLFVLPLRVVRKIKSLCSKVEQ